MVTSVTPICCCTVAAWLTSGNPISVCARSLSAAVKRRRSGVKAALLKEEGRKMKDEVEAEGRVKAIGLRGWRVARQANILCIAVAED